MEQKRFNRSRPGLSLWAVLGAVFILVPLFVFVSLESISRQKENTTTLLVEKGAALIRSFEAGARTGMMGMQWGGRQVQRLLSETAKQDDIVYLLVTDTRGTILAHNDFSKIGRKYGTELDLESLSGAMNVQWRNVSHSDSSEIFEVFRRFSPVRGRFKGRRGRMSPNDWCLPHMRDEAPGALPGQVIFVGLDMGPVEKARKEDALHTVIMAFVLLLVGSAGIVSIFLAQAYRSTRTSLARVKAFSDHLIENMPIGIIAMDKEETITSFNQAAESVLGMRTGDVLGRKPEEVLPASLNKIIIDLKVDKKFVDSETDCPLPGKGTVPLEVIATRLREKDGGFLGYVVLLRDLTQIQKLEKEIARSKHLASIGRLAAGVAHEIRNPLSSIKGFATYFRDRYKDVPEDKKTAEIMVEEVERLNRVISQLLEFAKPESINKKPTSLQKVVSHAIKMIEGQAGEKNIDIHTDLMEGDDLFLVDEDRIGQALLNLYLNAIEAMKEGGRLTVTLAKQEVSGGLVIEVVDTGAGISPDDLPHVFDPYFTTKKSGTGLGLAIVHRIIESHGGTVTVRSTRGEGTRVRVELPNN